MVSTRWSTDVMAVTVHWGIVNRFHVFYFEKFCWRMTSCLCTSFSWNASFSLVEALARTQCHQVIFTRLPDDTESPLYFQPQLL